MINTRDPAKIDYIRYDEERGITVWIGCVGRDDGWGQGFGGYHLGDDAHRKMFVADICATFGVSDPEALIGKPCFVLRAFAGLNEPIVGLESEETGRRFVVTDFCRKHWPGNAKGPLANRVSSLLSSLRNHERRAQEIRAELDRVADNYVEWRST